MREPAAQQPAAASTWRARHGAAPSVLGEPAPARVQRSNAGRFLATAKRSSIYQFRGEPPYWGALAPGPLHAAGARHKTMHISDIFKASKSTCSFEFFPPKTEPAANRLYETLRDLERVKPSFVSVTYGAGGSSRQLTHDLVTRIQQTTKLTAIPHLTCVCHREEEIEEILGRYAAAGVSNILALSGDLPAQRPGYDRRQDTFQHAADLVRFIQRFNGSGRHPYPLGFGLGVAGYPEGHPATPNRLQEMDYLKAKVDAGADYICTQLFFDNRDFHDFRERCELAGIRIPIIAGIMPITTVAGMRRMATLAGGARFPAPLLRAVQRAAHDPGDVEKVGVEWATEQCLELLAAGVRGIHFYTLNQSKATLAVYDNLCRTSPHPFGRQPETSRTSSEK